MKNNLNAFFNIPLTCFDNLWRVEKLSSKLPFINIFSEKFIYKKSMLLSIFVNIGDIKSRSILNDFIFTFIELIKFPGIFWIELKISFSSFVLLSK